MLSLSSGWAHRVRVRSQLVPLDDLHHLVADRAGQRVPTEGCPVHAGLVKGAHSEVIRAILPEHSPCAYVPRNPKPAHGV